MSDVFMSYASADREAARIVADALSANGWSVWWDRTIPVGGTWDDMIEEQLDAASCVVVLWSKASVASSWVKSESAEAMRRGILVPALIEETKIPLEFRRLQAADLSNWRSNMSAEEVKRLLASIASHVSRATTRGSESLPPSTRTPSTGVNGSVNNRPSDITAGQNARIATTTASTHVGRWVAVIGVGIALIIGGYAFYAQQVAERQKQVAAAEAREQERLNAAARAQKQARPATSREVPEQERRTTPSVEQSFLLSPPNNSSFDHFPRDVTLAWHSVPRAAAYTVEIDCYQCCVAGKWCTDVGNNWQSVPNLRETSYHFQWVGAQPGRWRVKAIDSNGHDLTVSDWWQFAFTK